MIVLHRTKNGWIVANEEYMSNRQIPDCFVFETMRGAASHLVKMAGEAKRDKKGRFLSGVKP